MERNTYRTSELLDILGVSRDALRYYEEKGIVRPHQDETNHYRQYQDYDIYRLLVSDFYKKRNLSMKEVRELQDGRTVGELETLLAEKAEQLEETIRNKEYMLQKVKETKEFCMELKEHLNQYSIRKLPTYKVLGKFSDFYSFLEYPVILEKMDMKKDDILSKIMRKFTFDKNGFIDSEMYIVEKQKRLQMGKSESYLHYSRCIYLIVEDGTDKNEDDDIKHEIFKSTLQWANEQGYKLKGVAFVNTRLITYLDHKERAFLEIYIPIEEKEENSIGIDLGVIP
ncbi:MerR family transcriptional regulator [Bacillus sp. FJAT-49711]|uniref:MerR family transcriptional regulator n=1 Tax=Bacillus sp. FJAT-49711 TaxID=2833585 RepID=UPI001BC9BF2C|nr:MerR family transcriptional regulator [Bacillus sp. FJAT-49711]MBS4218310.1 MerR family transcriptional regulator [Bacillus sp. FJAT-49711]